MMSNKKIDIKDKYSHELMEFENKLQDLEQSRIYELSGAKMDGYLSTNIKYLREKINGLIKKIEYDIPSTMERISEVINKL